MYKVPLAVTMIRGHEFPSSEATGYISGEKSRLDTSLELLVEEQKRDVEDNNLLFAQGIKNTSELFEAYTKSTLFQDIPREMAKWNGRVDQQELMRDFRGRIFSDLAFLKVQADYYPNSILLDQQRTTLFYKQLFPDKEEIHLPFGISTLSGVSVPDGLLIGQKEIGKSNIDTIVEYTSHDKFSNFIYKCGVHKKQAAIFSGNSREKLFTPKRKVLFAVPKFHDRNIAPAVVAQYPEAEFLQFMNRELLNQFTGDLLRVL